MILQYAVPWSLFSFLFSFCSSLKHMLKANISDCSARLQIPPTKGIKNMIVVFIHSITFCVFRLLSPNLLGIALLVTLLLLALTAAAAASPAASLSTALVVARLACVGSFAAAERDLSSRQSVRQLHLRADGVGEVRDDQDVLDVLVAVDGQYIYIVYIR
jgi:hypothetical protein